MTSQSSIAPEKEVTLADGLSCLPKKKSQQIELDIKVQFVQFSENKMSDLKQESLKDPMISALKDIIVEGWPEQRRDLPKTLEQFLGYRDELVVGSAKRRQNLYTSKDES